jgi:hypothetical protein
MFRDHPLKVLDVAGLSENERFAFIADVFECGNLGILDIGGAFQLRNFFVFRVGFVLEVADLNVLFQTFRLELDLDGHYSGFSLFGGLFKRDYFEIFGVRVTLELLDRVLPLEPIFLEGVVPRCDGGDQANGLRGQILRFNDRVDFGCACGQELLDAALHVGDSKRFDARRVLETTIPVAAEAGQRLNDRDYLFTDGSEARPMSTPENSDDGPSGGGGQVHRAGIMANVERGLLKERGEYRNLTVRT